MALQRSERQAIIVIHGIGEQSPMDTLRRFVNGLGLGFYYNKPDRVSESAELRRLTLPRGRRRPATDFFELYWAHEMPPGKAREILAWSWRLAFSRTSVVAENRLRPHLRVLRALAISAIVALATLVATLGVALVFAILGKDLPQPETRVALLAALAMLLLALAVNTVSGSFIRRAVVDAERYLTPRPRSIVGRNAIRSAGVQLLRNLHTDGNYVRIVVVGHSLGSVIGYDILRQAYDELRGPDPRCFGPQPEAESFYQKAAALGASPERKELDAFQQAQLRLWMENRNRGVPWLVTDLITLGSPLTHADLLLNRGEFTLRERQVEREYPTCPPAPDKSGDPLYRANVERAGLIRSMKVANSGAVFSSTRWTNLYFPTRNLIVGDLVGGPVAPKFGVGVLDVPIHRFADEPHERWRRFFPFPHLDYWRPGTPTTGMSRRARTFRRRHTGTSDALSMVRHFLSLDIERARGGWPHAQAATTMRATDDQEGDDQ